MRRAYSSAGDSGKNHSKSGKKSLAHAFGKDRKLFNPWIFESPKNARRLTIDGDLNFMLCVLLEGDVSVTGYKVLNGSDKGLVESTAANIFPDLIVERSYGPAEWWEVSRSGQQLRDQASAGPLAQAAELASAVYVRLILSRWLLGQHAIRNNMDWALSNWRNVAVKRNTIWCLACPPWRIRLPPRTCPKALGERKVKKLHRMKIGMFAASMLALAACSTDPTQRKVGVALEDTAITAKVKAALAGDPDVKGRDVSVETFRGTVQLSGFVDSPANVARAADLARRVDGVREVRNSLIVK